ncbi:hypothetical protein [Angelakisella massiliensis]|uniref:hypothetical protein n=1 Tax=Angelakisella massiliensis TaxID=1871018 RepID=UPI0024B05D22|nr:hypothetical protein [Angelakisella massiliensis]
MCPGECPDSPLSDSASTAGRQKIRTCASFYDDGFYFSGTLALQRFFTLPCPVKMHTALMGHQGYDKIGAVKMMVEERPQKVPLFRENKEKE